MRAALFGAFAAAVTAAAHAQTLFFSGTLACGALAGSPPGAAPILITQRGYRADYSMEFASGPLSGLSDRGRGGLLGLDLSMRGGGEHHGMSVATAVSARRRNLNYLITATQGVTGPGLPGRQTRVCRGIANLVVR